MPKLFQPPSWAHHTNIYEVNIRQYTEEGTFRAFREHLPRLRSMGVETLWLMPVTPISREKRKGTLGSYYACSDYKAVNPEFGSLDDLKGLISDAQQQGFKVIIDWVANHTGWDHVWTKTHPDYYKIDPLTHDFKMPGGMEDIIELDHDNPSMRAAMIGAMTYWISECNIDGFRCDLASWVVLDFWKQARKELDQVKPLFWLGEFDELENPEYGEVFDASYSWLWMHKTLSFYQQQISWPDLYSILKRYDDLGDSSMRTWFTSNHDENSWNGTEYEKYGAMALPLAVFSITWNGIPLVYSGQELPNRKRLKFFDKDQIDWENGIGLNVFYRTLLQLHSDHPALAAGDPLVRTFTVKTTASPEVFVYLRVKEDRQVLVLLNFSPKAVEVGITDERVKGLFRNVFDELLLDLAVTRQFSLSPWGCNVFEK